MTTRVIVYHRMYGCDTGCCGHVVEITDDTGAERSIFEFDHPHLYTAPDVGEETRRYIRELVTDTFGEEHCADIDWDNCHVSSD